MSTTPFWDKNPKIEAKMVALAEILDAHFQVVFCPKLDWRQQIKVRKNRATVRPCAASI